MMPFHNIHIKTLQIHYINALFLSGNLTSYIRAFILLLGCLSDAYINLSDVEKVMTQ